MTHDEFKKLAAAGGPTTPEQEQAVRSHVENCADCLSVETDTAPRPKFQWWLAAAAILFLALWIWREAAIRVARERLDSERAQIVELTSARDLLRDQKEKLAGEFAVISAPGVKIIALSSQKAGSAAAGRLFFDPATHRAVLVESGLPSSGNQSDYQIWLYGAAGSKPHNGGVFDVVNGHATASIPSVPADAQSIAVTLEKNGGSPEPGTSVVLSGRL